MYVTYNNYSVLLKYPITSSTVIAYYLLITFKCFTVIINVFSCFRYEAVMIVFPGLTGVHRAGGDSARGFHVT